MVKDGKMMWNEMVKANWMRDSRSGSSSDISRTGLAEFGALAL